MAISDYDETAGNNTDISAINIDENCPPANLNDAIRQLMADLAVWYGDRSVFVSNANQPAVSATALDISAYTEGTWIDIGNTAAGATKTWAALDSVPDDADWIEIRVVATLSRPTSTVLDAILFARPNGSAVAAGNSTRVMHVHEQVATGTGTVNAYPTHTFKVGVSSMTFDIYLSTSATVTKTLYSFYLTGYGQNS